MLLWSVLLNEFGERCCTSTTLDLQKAKRRVEHEGLSFLTITLPAFCKDFEKSLEEGKVDRDLFTGFQFRGGLPLFLGGFLDRVFDRGSGVLLQDPDIESIFAIRQLTLIFSKILLPCSPEREASAIAGYLQCEQEVRRADQDTSAEDLLGLQRISALLFRDVFTIMDQMVYNGDITGKHGPGATADKLKGNRKYDLREWPARLEKTFPFWENAIPNARYLYRYDLVSLLEPGQERPVKVTLVPKTLKTPRVIAIEPTAVQYMQQGIMEQLVKLLESDQTVSSMIGFSDQVPNQDLAREGSSNGLLATLDLSEASDRVSNQHVRVMLQRFPSFFEAVDATRSRKADVFGKVIRLAKFASMGSALCFPFEAMVFLTIIFKAIERRDNTQMTRKRIRSLRGQVRVYGDDIIVPVDYVPSVISELENFGFRVNTGKSFWNGKFRESCGKEYYDGHDVSIVKCRRQFPTSRTDVSEMISLVAMRNLLYLKGLWRTAGYLDEIVGPLLGNHYPMVSPGLTEWNEDSILSSSPLLGRVTFLEPLAERVHPDLQTPLVKGWQVVPKPPISPISGEGALLKSFLKRGDQPFADRRHLERQGRPQSVDIKLRWKTPY